MARAILVSPSGHTAARRAGRIVAGTLLALALPLVLGADAASSAEPRRWALLVGVDQYVRLDGLQCAGNDQAVLARELGKAGFPADQIVLIHDAAREKRLLPFRENIERELRLLLGIAGPGDVVLFSFSGHGVHVDGTSYLCPTEADLDRPEQTLIPVDEVFRRLNESSAAMKVVVVDACRNDPRLPGARDADGRERLLDGFSRSLQDPPAGLVLLSSCGIGQQSMEDANLRHGVFMYHLIEGIRGRAANPQGSVTLASLYDYASLETKKHVAKRWGSLQTPGLKGELEGAFEIARRDPTAARDDASAPDNAPAGPDLGGIWRGTYTYDDGTPPVPFVVNFVQAGEQVRGAVNEPNTCAQVNVATLRATLRGSLDPASRTVRWVKTYDGVGASHSIEYVGVVSPDGIRIERGRWNADRNSGGFSLVRTGT
mgnify:CR=1 FL=1